ncbi:hypothetical protein HTZ77_03690 [Nonomuraea sp. SMC257]|uniref:Peptidase M60 domain-containing protein n=1 Tax=Nonomuraea montanisoli TaxID=2741721 RepID=A0A7Y6M0H2_9ACTN|nr:M60 family metallopeptidase [Nonomuraea montanisoli]NUW30528.1 hypothetical protein [Nonomuraea montanisoli]
MIGVFDRFAAIPSPRRYQLRERSNVIRDPHGGPIYLCAAPSSDADVATFVSGAIPMPTFHARTTSEADFSRQLDAHVDCPHAELVDDRFFITVSRRSALSFRAENHEMLLRSIRTVIRSQAQYSGLDASAPAHMANRNPFHLTEVDQAPFGVRAYATHGYVAFTRSCVDQILSVNGVRQLGWGLWHELGHQHQLSALTPGSLIEVSANLYALATQRRFGLPSRLLQARENGRNAYHRALSKRGTVPYEQLDDFERLIPLRQLELAYGPGVWGRAHRLVRQDAPRARTDNTRYGLLAYYASLATGRDLSDFFSSRWLFPVEASHRAMTNSLNLPLPDRDLFELHE